MTFETFQFDIFSLGKGKLILKCTNTSLTYALRHKVDLMVCFLIFNQLQLRQMIYKKIQMPKSDKARTRYENPCEVQPFIKRKRIKHTCEK